MCVCACVPVCVCVCVCVCVYVLSVCVCICMFVCNSRSVLMSVCAHSTDSFCLLVANNRLTVSVDHYPLTHIIAVL